MKPASERDFLVCINGAAGRQAQQALAQRIRERLPAARLLALVELEPGPLLAGELDRLARRCAAADAVLVVAGGDGTISAALAAVRRHQVVLGVIPVGTFNFFARDRGIPLQPEAALDLLLQGQETRLPLAWVNGIPFCVSASLGVYPRIIAVREQVSALIGRHRLVSLLSGLWVFLTRARGRRLLLTYDGRQQRVRAPMLLASVSPAQLAHFELVEAAAIEQGRMLVFVMQSDATWTLLHYLWACLSGDLKRLQPLQMFLTRQLRVGCRRRSLSVAVDGELHRCRLPLQLRVEAGALRCLVPAEAAP